MSRPKMTRSGWSDDDLLKEADEHDLNPTEARMLSSMMDQFKAKGRLTDDQRAWLDRVIDDRPMAPPAGGWDVSDE